MAVLCLSPSHKRRGFGRERFWGLFPRALPPPERHNVPKRETRLPDPAGNALPPRPRAFMALCTRTGGFPGVHPQREHVLFFAPAAGLSPFGFHRSGRRIVLLPEKKVFHHGRAGRWKTFFLRRVDRPLFGGYNEKRSGAAPRQTPERGFPSRSQRPPLFVESLYFLEVNAEQWTRITVVHDPARCAANRKTLRLPCQRGNVCAVRPPVGAAGLCCVPVFGIRTVPG